MQVDKKHVEVSSGPSHTQNLRRRRKSGSWDRAVFYDLKSGDVDIRRKGDINTGNMNLIDRA
jgi:hypothetical protein